MYAGSDRSHFVYVVLWVSRRRAAVGNTARRPRHREAFARCALPRAAAPYASSSSVAPSVRTGLEPHAVTVAVENGGAGALIEAPNDVASGDPERTVRCSLAGTRHDSGLCSFRCWKRHSHRAFLLVLSCGHAWRVRLWACTALSIGCQALSSHRLSACSRSSASVETRIL